MSIQTHLAPANSEETVVSAKRQAFNSVSTRYRALLVQVRNERHDATSHLDVARFLLRTKDFDRAMSHLRLARALQPRRSATYRLLAWAYRGLKNLPQAATALSQLLRLEPADLAANFQLARILLEQGKEGRATRHLTRAITVDPKLRAAYRLLAQLSERRGELSTALSYIEHLLELSPDNPKLHALSGRVHARAGHPDRAIARLRRCLEIEGGNFEARHTLAQVMLKEGAADEALVLLEEGSSLAGAPPELLMLQGQCHQLLGDRPRALAIYITASRRMPDSPTPHLALGKLYSLEEDYDLAEDEYRKALRAQPNSSEAYRCLGSLYVRSGSPTRAEKLFLEMIEVFPSSPEAQSLLGEARERFHQLEGAVDAYSKAIELAPGDAHLHVARAKARVKNGDYDSAIIDFQRARELDPDCEEAGIETELIRGHKRYREAFTIHERAQEALTAGDIESARKHFDRVLELVPNNVRWLEESANLAIATGHYEQAIASLRRVLAVEGSNGQLLLRLADLLSATNKFDQAGPLYEQCVTAQPMNIGARIRLIRTFAHRSIAGSLSPDKFPRLENAYRAALTEGSGRALAHLELAHLYLGFGSQIFPTEEWQRHCANHFRLVGDRCSPDTLRHKLLGELELARRTENQTLAAACLEQLCDRFPKNSTYAVALLEQLKEIGSHSRAFRFSERFRQRFPLHGLIQSLTFEFFGILAAKHDKPAALCRRRINELQRAVAQAPENFTAYLQLGLGLMILSPLSEHFGTGRKVVIALNRARNIQPNNPWSLWGLLKETLRPTESSKAKSKGKDATICRNGLRLHPTFSPFLEHLGRGLLQSTDPVERDQGRLILERACIVDPDCAGALYTLARHYHQSGDKVVAWHYYTKILESSRGAFHAKRALEHLSKLVY